MVGDVPEETETIAVGSGVDTHVRLEMGLHAEITPPFMEAFVETQDAIYRLAALVKYGAADIRHLSQADRDHFKIVVKVEDGSSEIWGKYAEAIGRIGEAAAGKMSPRQIIALVTVLGLLVAGPTGLSTYLEHRKDVRKEEMQHEERLQAIEGLEFANKRAADLARDVLA